MTIETAAQTVVIDPVTSIVVTAVTQDTEAGDYYREVRVFDASSSDVVFTLRVRATTADPLHIATPAADF